MSARSILRAGLRLASIAALLWYATAAHAVDYKFPGAFPPGCSGTNGSYTCGNLTLSYNDTITVLDPRPATITINGSLTTDTNSINGSGTASDLTLIVNGSVTLSYKTVINANITAGSVIDKKGQATLGGSITTTTGDITLDYRTNVAGSITTDSGAITIGQEDIVGGSVTSKTGSIAIGYAATINGSVTGGASVKLDQNSTVAGSVTGSTTSVAVGYAAKVKGAISSAGKITVAQNAVASSCVTSTSSSSITLDYQSSVNSVCCGSSCGTSCVVNNSNGAMPPACKAPAPPSPPFYLSSSGGFPSSTLSTTAPTNTTLANYDSSRDSAAGLVIGRSASGPDETDSKKYQRWLSSTAGAVLSGSLELQIWVGVKAFAPDKVGAVVAYLRDCDGTGANCKAITSASLTIPATGKNNAGWLQQTVGFGSVNYTVSAGRTLELKVIVGSASEDDLWFAYDTTAYPSVLAAPSVVKPDHYELSLPTSSISCLPSTVTVTACSNATSPCTNPSTSLSGATASLSTTGATLGATTVTFNSKGVATTTLSYPAASQGAVASVTLSGESTAATASRQCCPDGVKCAVANSCSTTFSTAGFIISASTTGSAATLPTQTAGTASGTYYLRAVETNTSTGACTSALSGANTVNWAYQCNNPTTCSSGNLMSVNGGTATAITGNPNTGVSSYGSVAMTFDGNGNAPFTFTYADVGQVTLYASKSAGGSLLSNLTGNSNAFVVKPANLVVSNLKQTATPNLANPAAASATGAKFIKAGEAFTATVTAQTSGGAATPNFGRESPAEGVTLSPTLVLPAGGTTGTLSNAGIAGASFASGAATVGTLAYSEVGIVTLSASIADGSYLGAGNVTGTASANIGRFFPAKFVLSAPSVTHRSGLACSPASSFTHLGENFSLVFTLTAQNVAGATTANYVGAFAKLDPTTATGWNIAGLGGTTAFSTTSGRLSLGTATGSWSNGVAKAVSVVASATRATTPDGPFNATFGIAPTDSDGVAMSAFDMASASGGVNDRTTVASVPLRFGRLRLSSAVGPADRVLSLPVTAQYWSGSTWDTNTLDSCTTVPTTAFNFGNLMRSITAADTAASSGIALSSGSGLLKLAAPAAGRVGTYDIALSLGSTATDASCLQPWTPAKGDEASAGANLAFLRGAWCGSTYGNDPSARATFGQQSTQQNQLYRRENY